MKNYRKQKILLVSVVFSILLLLACFNSRNPYSDVLSISFTGCDFTEEKNQCHSDNSLELSSESIRVKKEQFILEPGEYIIEVNYNANDTNSTLMLWSNKSSADGINPGELINYMQLNPSNDSISSNFNLDKYISDLGIYIDYDGQGKLTINSISIKSVGNYFNDSLIINVLLILIGIVSFILLTSNKFNKLINENKFTIYISLFLFLLITIPFFLSGWLHNASHQDLLYHLDRIEGLSDSISAGYFLPKIHHSELNGYGQALGALYPEIFLVFPALLRSLGMSLILAYKLFIIAINASTIAIAYFSFKNIFKSKFAGNIGMIVFTLAIYRLTALMVRSAVGEYLAIMFIPLVIWGLYEVFYGNQKKYYLLVFGMTGLIQSHLITIELVSIVCIIFGIVNMKLIFTNRKIIIALIKSIFLFIALNIWWLVPFFDFGLQGLNAFNRNSGIEEPIIRNILQLFAFDYPLQAGENMPFSIGILLLISFLLFIFILIRNSKFRKTKRFKIGLFISAVGCLALWMSTVYFPWRNLYQFDIVLKFASTLQFSWRLLTIASACFSLLFVIVSCEITKNGELKGKLYTVIVLILFTVFSLKIVIGYLIEVPKSVDRHFQAEISDESYTIGGWYLPENTDTFFIYYRPQTLFPDNSSITINDFIRTYNQISFNFNGNASKLLTIELPLIYYDNYICEVSNGSCNIEKSNDNLLQISISDAENAKVSVKYKEKAVYIYASFISISALIYLVLITMKKRSDKV